MHVGTDLNNVVGTIMINQQRCSYMIQHVVNMLLNHVQAGQLNHVQAFQQAKTSCALFGVYR